MKYTSLRPGLRPRTTWVHCNNVAVCPTWAVITCCCSPEMGVGGRCVSVCQRVCYINSSPPKCLWFDMDDWQPEVPEEPSYHVWSVSASVPWRENLLKEPVEVCACVCVFIYVHRCSGEWENKWEWACRWVCMGAREGEIKSASSCVTYVFVYPCMRCLRKYKTQKRLSV